MACFTVPMVEAVVTTVVYGIRKAKEKKEVALEETHTGEDNLPAVTQVHSHGFTKKLSWLNSMLWGGSALLAFEHLWHGEVVPWFPFLTNAVNPADRTEMFSEMATNGVTMAILVTAVWGILVGVSYVYERKMRQVQAPDQTPEA